MKSPYLKTLLLLLISSPFVFSQQDRITLEGDSAKPGKGKHIVLLAGDHEYRSEEYLPMMAQILSAHHGFKTTTLFAQDQNGKVDPNSNSTPGLEVLADADAVILGLRFRDWSEQDFTHFDNALKRGVSFLSTRTSTHAFKTDKPNWKHYSFNAQEKWKGGFGREVLGETWVSHHGHHGKEGTMTVPEVGQEGHPILRGVGVIYGPTDVYGAAPLNPEAILLRGLVTETMEPESPPLNSEKNNPPMPVAWTKLYKNSAGKTNKVFTTTLGSGIDFLDDDLRRLLVNATYWATDLEVPEKAEVSFIKSYVPQHFKGSAWRKNLTPADFLELKDAPFTLPHLQKDALKKVEKESASLPLELKKGTKISLLGGGTFSRMMKFSEFETEMHLRFPAHDLIIRNMADEGNSPGFRPHSSRKSSTHYAFPGAKELLPLELQNGGTGNGFHPTPDEWLKKAETDLILACFGSHEHFRGEAGVENFKKELQGFIDHTLQQKYNGSTAPDLILLTPPAIQDLSHKLDVPSGEKGNSTLSLYAQAIVETAAKNNLPCIDLFTGTLELGDTWQRQDTTIDGVNLTRLGYKLISPLVTQHFSASPSAISEELRASTLSAVAEKNWMWHQYFKVPNGVHVEGTRHGKFGPDNYPAELRKLEKMISVRDQYIHATVQEKPFNLAEADLTTGTLPEIKTSYNGPEKAPEKIYKAGKESLSTFTLPEGYEIGLFADESRFPNLANPCQMTFDKKGRLWVGVMPIYPHWRPGDPKPNDKLLIYEDTNQDGVADIEKVFLDGLHLFSGFELLTNKEGQQQALISQQDSLILFTDTDGDDRADQQKILLSGFDDHDTHHQISAFYTDPGGGIIMGEGLFLMSSVETAYGVERGTNGGFFRFDPQSSKLTRILQADIPNPWGIVYDDYGQGFYLNTSDPTVWWLDWGAQKPIYGFNAHSPSLLTSHQVRPTAGLEIISSRHFPEEVQGDLVFCNAKGFLGAKQHALKEDSTAYTSEYRHDLFHSRDPNVRPVDIETAPDGSLYFLDWHNVLIGHAQYSARDPLRDHSHGRIYRITYPSRPLVTPPTIAGADIDTLLKNLTLPEARARYRTREELRSRSPEEIIPKLKQWVTTLSDDRLKLEALWVSWGINHIDLDLLKELSSSTDHRIRAAVMQVVRYQYDKIPDAFTYLTQAAKDAHGRVRLGALNTATFLKNTDLQAIYDLVEKSSSQDEFFIQPLLNAKGLLTGTIPPKDLDFRYPHHLQAKNMKKERARYKKGYKLYIKDGHCATCHQKLGQGLPDAGIPPLQHSEWVNKDPETLIKIALHGVSGPITVKKKEYNSAMIGFAGLLNDEELSNVLYFITQNWAQKPTTITPDDIKKVRDHYKDRVTPWTVDELSQE